MLASEGATGGGWGGCRRAKDEMRRRKLDVELVRDMAGETPVSATDAAAASPASELDETDRWTAELREPVGDVARRRLVARSRRSRAFSSVRSALRLLSMARASSCVF